MLSVRNAIPLGIAALLGGCMSEPPPGPMVVVVPGTGRDIATFQQDDSICLRHATDHTGYDTPLPATNAQNPATPTAAAPASGAQSGDPPDQVAYVQCMASRGDTVKVQAPPPGADDEYAYSYAYPYSGAYPYYSAYPYALGYPYGFGYGYPGLYMDEGFFGGIGWYGGGWGRGRWGHGRWGHGGWGHGGGHGHGHGGGHGGGGHR